ncbi:NAD(P)H-quinone dehydrogenase [Micrococcales bacterium 31B]|nr:NAD(P)H-quinone dehydrogenase [Micrococcales bacterium 31B]
MSAVAKDVKVVIVGGGPGGYEAALGAAQLGAHVSLVEPGGLGGNAVITDVVPSKTLIATAGVLDTVSSAGVLGIRDGNGNPITSQTLSVDLGAVNRRVKRLATLQSEHIRMRLHTEKVHLHKGWGRLKDAHTVEVVQDGHVTETLEAEVILVAVGTTPRELPDALPDGERILTWKQLYDIDERPEHLIVVGSGVTGAEFASAYHALGVRVTLVSSRDRVLPGEDIDAAEVLQNAFERRGITVMSHSRAVAARRTETGVAVTLEGGREIEGSHVLMAVGAIPSTGDLGLREVGVNLSANGHIEVDGVSRTNIRSIYAAGDCTGVFPLASVAAMQGRIAMWHALGDAVQPLRVRRVSSNVFTSPEIATIGTTHEEVLSGREEGEVIKLSLHTNARAKMQGLEDGFIKLIARRGSGTLVGATIVAPQASELIHPLAVAIESHLNVDTIARAFTVYPSLSGSIGEAARQLHLLIE